LNTFGHTSLIRDIIVTKDKDIISASDDKSIIVWNSKDGKIKQRILGQIGDNSGEIYAIALSNDEKYLAVGGYFSGTKKSGNRYLIRIYNYKTARLLGSLKSHKNVVNDISFSDDDRYLISGSSDNSAKIWSVKSNFKLIDTIKLHNDDVYAVKIIRNNNRYYAVTAGYDNRIYLYDLKSKTAVTKHRLNAKLGYLAVNNKLKHIAVSGFSKEIRIYDFNLKLIKIIENNSIASGLAYSENGKYMLAGTNGLPFSINLYEVDDDYDLEERFKKHNNTVLAVAFLDNKTAISGGGDNEIYVWDIDSTDIKQKIKGVGDNIWSVGVDGDNIAWGKIDPCDDCSGMENRFGELQKTINLKTFKIIDVEDEDDFKRVSTRHKNYSLKHSNGGKYEYDAVLEVLRSGVFKTKIIKDSRDGLRHNCYGWYKNYIISGGANGSLVIYNKRGVKIASLVGHKGEIWSIAIDGDRLVSGSSDQSIKVWNLKELNYKSTLSPLVTIFISKENEYVVYTKDGFFVSSKKGTKYVGYHINRGINKEALYIPVDSLYDTFYRPDLIQKVLSGGDISKYAKNININRLLKYGLAPTVKILTKSKTITNQNIDVKLQICPRRKGGYNNLALSINGTTISVTGRSRALKLSYKKLGACFTINQKISLTGGKNTIGFKATNRVGNIHSNTSSVNIFFDDTQYKLTLKDRLEKELENEIKLKLTEKTEVDSINNLHILALAINNYRDKKLNLKYSINDANKIIDTIKKVSKPIFNKIYIHKLFNKQATRKNIKKIFGTIKSNRNDVFLLYIAGHGVTDKYNGKYYFIPYEFNKKVKVYKQGVGQRDLMLGLSKIKALKSLVMLDTCESGSFVEASMQRTITNRLAKATGRATISASSKTQVALEGYKGHGVFTYTIMEALNGKGYQDDEEITVDELSSYVKKVLPKRTYKKWNYKQTPQSSIYGINFIIGKED
jgi:WD40 repeat protein